MPATTVTTPGHSIPGLTNGLEYDVSVVAYNSAGGTSSAITGIGTPAEAGNVPSAPTSLVLTPGSGSVTATWGAPASPGSGDVTGYNVLLLIGDTRQERTGIIASSPTATFTGLVNGSEYTVVVVAVNAAGEGVEVSGTVTPAAVPSAPTALVLTPGDTTLVATWAAPTSNGGSAVTSYTSTLSATGETDQVYTGPELTHTFTGLTNGVVYTLRVVATNTSGSGVSVSAAATPVDVPEIPLTPVGLIVTKPASGQLQLSWTPPGSDGGSAITGYKITYTPTGGSPTTVTSSVPNKLLTGLTNGTAYALSVQATNAVGDSLALTGTGTPAAAPVVVPGTPTSLVVTSGNGAATVTWGVPATGSTVVTYAVRIVGSGVDQTSTVAGTAARTVSFAGLTNGVEYTVTVTATNTAGTSSAASATVTPAAPAVPPSSPSGVATTPGDGFIAVQWSAPANPGTSAILGYTITAVAPNQPGDTEVVAADVLGAVLTGLTNGITYSVTVTAYSTAGTSPASTATATPIAPILTPAGAPQGLVVSAGGRELTATWLAPLDDGGYEVTGYQVTLSIGNEVLDTVETEVDDLLHTFTGLSSSIEYTVTVAAVTEAGAGIPTSDLASPTLLLEPPGPVTDAVAVALDPTSVQLTWTVPSTEGEPSGYIITSVPSVLVPNIVGNVDTVVITGLADDTEYVFTVTPVNAYGNGLSVVLDPVSTPVLPPVPPPVIPPPSPYAFPQPRGNQDPRVFKPANFGKTIDEVPVGE